MLQIPREELLPLLREIRHQESWKLLRAYLKELRRDALETLYSAREGHDADIVRGGIEALDQIHGLVDEVQGLVDEAMHEGDLKDEEGGE